MGVSYLALAVALQAAADKPPVLPAPVPPPVSWPAPPAPPPPPRFREPSRARANLASYVSDEDYPVEALLNEEQGTVGFRLYVGTDGRVTGCTVTQSSGSASLDDTTCAVMMRRARFSPAIGFDGRPVDDNVLARVRWQLIDETEPQCRADERDCDPPGFPLAAQRARPLAPLASHLSHADFPAEAQGANPPGTTRFRLTVGPDGRVAECEATQSSGSPALDAAACRSMRDRARFTPGRDAGGAAVSDSHWGHIRWRGLEAPPVPVPSTR